MFSVILCTCPVNEAENIARTLVNQKLVACVNVTPVSSYFTWEGQFQKENEALMIMKTTTKNIEKVTERIKELHSYDVPEIIALPVTDGNKEYLNWIMSSVE